jgi:hypothetical protein
MKTEENNKPVRKWSRSLLTLFFVIGAGIVLISTTGCKQADYNITGNWLVDFTLDDTASFLVAFSGSKTSGAVIWENQMSGEYFVSNRQVDYVLRIYISASNGTALVVYNFTGSFEDKDHMSGTLTAYFYDTPNDTTSGTWTAVRR